MFSIFYSFVDYDLKSIIKLNEATPHHTVDSLGLAWRSSCLSNSIMNLHLHG